MYLECELYYVYFCDLLSDHFIDFGEIRYILILYWVSYYKKWAVKISTVHNLKKIYLPYTCLPVPNDSGATEYISKVCQTDGHVQTSEVHLVIATNT